MRSFISFLHISNALGGQLCQHDSIRCCVKLPSQVSPFIGDEVDVFRSAEKRIKNHSVCVAAATYLVQFQVSTYTQADISPFCVVQ